MNSLYDHLSFHEFRILDQRLLFDGYSYALFHLQRLVQKFKVSTGISVITKDSKTNIMYRTRTYTLLVFRDSTLGVNYLGYRLVGLVSESSTYQID
jgi:hypothetical protein